MYPRISGNTLQIMIHNLQYRKLTDKQIRFLYTIRIQNRILSETSAMLNTDLIIDIHGEMTE
jgi:hypothetical protein